NPQRMRGGLILRHKPLPLKAFAEANSLSRPSLFEGWTFARSTRSKPDLDPSGPSSRVESAKREPAIWITMSPQTLRAVAR
ncbi:MAG: hypothetical protein ACYDD1_08135, partial [Caulobacteraceae bacterium]